MCDDCVSLRTLLVDRIDPNEATAPTRAYPEDMADAKDAKSEGKEDDELLFETLQHLEDLLYSGVTVTALGDSDDDEEWNAAESKDALAFRDELNDFEARALPAFDDTSAGGEFTLAHTSLHDEFVALVETRISSFLEQKGFAPRDFYARVKDAMDAPNLMMYAHLLFYYCGGGTAGRIHDRVLW